MCLKGDMKHVPPNTLDFPVNLTIIWCFILGVREMMQYLYVRGKNPIPMLKTLGSTTQNVVTWDQVFLEKKTLYILASKYRVQAAQSLQFQFIHVINYSLQRSSKSYALS
jgi:hypothetical protein